MGIFRKSLSFVSLAATMLVSVNVNAESAGNYAVSSDYLWRGATQSGHGAAVSGGLDYSHDAGVYAGTWSSTVYGGAEIDFYGGMTKDLGGAAVDVGAIFYLYPQNTDANFFEVYAGGTASIANFKAYYDITNEQIYFTAGADYDIKKNLSTNFTAGIYFDNGFGYTYSHYQLTITKTLKEVDFSLGVSAVHDDSPAVALLNDKPTAVVSLYKEFDFP